MIDDDRKQTRARRPIQPEKMLGRSVFIRQRKHGTSAPNGRQLETCVDPRIGWVLQDGAAIRSVGLAAAFGPFT